MKTYLSMICTCLTVSLFAQIEKGHQVKILNIVGKDFRILSNEKNYPYSSINNQCKIQPSITTKYDTTGISFNNEYLLFRHPIRYKTGKEVLKLMKPNYVTVAEYLEFQNYVKDSIAREKIYQCLKDDDDASKFIRHQDTYIYKGEEMSFDPSKREKYRNCYFPNTPIFPLNWKQPFSYSDDKIKPCLVDLYLPQPERIHTLKIFDERKLIYRYTDQYEEFETMPATEVGKIFEYLGQRAEFKAKVDHVMPTLSDTYCWSSNSRFDRDELSVLGQLYNRLLPEEPVIGITGMQVNAFCHWKQGQLQKELDLKGLKYKVVVSTPVFEDISIVNEPTFDIEERDYTNQWRITSFEYMQFVNFTRDSILRENLFRQLYSMDDASNLIQYSKRYFDEGILQMTDFGTIQMERKDWKSYFHLNYKYALNTNSFDGLAGKIMNSEIYRNPSFAYEYFDAQNRSIVGKMKTYTRYEYYQSEGTIDTTELIVFEIGENEEYVGKDFNMDYTNPLKQSYGVRSYQNLWRMIVHKSVPVLPSSEIEPEDEKSLIQSVSYKQAIAFYYWKYPIHKSKITDEWQKFVLPSEEQFRKVQNGEKVFFTSRTVSYPTPVFRYVVHIFPAR